jgi:ABC-type branched-subunit amino acid transport system substrate-binding protein
MAWAGLSGAAIGAQAQAQGGAIVIGQSAPLTGVLADTGKDMVLGGQIVFDEVNAQGGIGGRKIHHVVLDDGYEVERTLRNTRDLLDKHNAVALFGYAGTGNIQRLLTDHVLLDAGVAMVGPYTGGEPLRTPYNPNIFHVRAGYGDEVAVMVKMLTGVGLNRIGVMHQDDAFGQAGLQGVVDAMTAVNLRPAVVASYPKNTANVDEAAQTIFGKNPQAVIMISVNKSTAAFISKYRALSVSTLLLNVSVVNSVVIAKSVGEQGMRGFSIAQVVPDPQSNALKVARDYRATLKRFGGGADPSATSFEEYIAARTLVEGLHRSRAVDRAAVMAGLESLTKLDLGGYTVSFGPGNRRGSRYVDILAVGEGGKILR